MKKHYFILPLVLLSLTGCSLTITSNVSSNVPIIGHSSSTTSEKKINEVKNITLNHEDYSNAFCVSFKAQENTTSLINTKEELRNYIEDKNHIIEDIGDFSYVYKSPKNILIGGEKKENEGKLTLKLNKSYKAIEITCAPRYHTYVDDWESGTEKLMIDTSYVSNKDTYVKLNSEFTKEEDVKATVVAFKYDESLSSINLSTYFGQVNLEKITIYF